jgi:hypothetical protein
MLVHARMLSCVFESAYLAYRVPDRAQLLVDGNHLLFKICPALTRGARQLELRSHRHPRTERGWREEREGGTRTHTSVCIECPNTKT